ncbi:unnamed protein product [Ranitomeya imitator]|uniref:Reverse transcriptase domain-containing protein n=1 Tax=Ranitomeya imitator TaxID=111125 RepID=A0ABN9LG46_9NEOB|nr:unnamed protein product [Ranitomeya imitator]
MELITKHEEIEINHIKDDITKIQTSLNKYNNVEDFNILNQRMEKNLLKLEEHVADIKHDKFQRDKRDYELNQVYTWKISRTWNRRNRRPQHDFFDSNYKGRRVSFTASHESMGSSSSNHNTSEDFSDVSFGSNRHNETFNERSGAISKAKNAGGGRGGSTNELLDYSILRDLQSDSLEKDCNMNKDFGTPNALFYPVQSRPTVLDTFQELVERDLMKLDSNIDFVHDNLTVLERQAISNLRHNEDLLIRQADKGGGVVILNAGLYYVENLRILSDCSTYTQIPYDPTKEFQIHLEKLLVDGLSTGAITQKIYDYLNIKHPVIPIYHAFPKIHKNVFPPPFRAIISGIGSLSENLGEWVDHFLQPLVINLPGYIKDTKAVIAALDGFLWSSHYTWVTCDVVGLYPSIPHNIILTSLSYFLNKYSTYKQEIQFFIIDSVSFLLTHNYFSFDRLFFIQKKGVSMGGKCSPSLANITVAVWEEKYIFNENNPFSNNIVFFGRYIDDLIIIWKGEDMLITDFIKYVNNTDFNLSFTFNTSKTSINYLDISLSVNENTNLVAVSPYRKSTDSNSILEAHSCHPKHVIKNIPVGEFIRLKRNCSSAAQFTQETESAVFRLKDRGYPNWMLHRAKSVTKDIDRKSLLWSDNEDSGSLSRNPNKNNNKMKKIKRKRLNENKHTEPASHSLSTINFSTVYSPQYAEIIQIVKKYVPILYSDVKLAHILDRTHIRYLAKKAPSLRDILSPSLYLHSKLTAGNSAWLTYKGFFKCGHHPCKTCNFVRKTTSFTSSVTGITYPIRTHMNCNSEGVIYLIECDLCKLQYVGCTVGPLKRGFVSISQNLHLIIHHITFLQSLTTAKQSMQVIPA